MKHPRFDWRNIAAPSHLISELDYSVHWLCYFDRLGGLKLEDVAHNRFKYSTRDVHHVSNASLGGTLLLVQLLDFAKA